MADIYLGLTASAIAPLPPIRWTGGGGPTFPIDYPKQYIKSSIIDGSDRFHALSKQPRRWTLTWEMLTTAELADLMILNGYDQALYFQNNWEDASWREVMIVGFEYFPVVNIGPTACRYGLTMTLEEVV